MSDDDDGLTGSLSGLQLSSQPLENITRVLGTIKTILVVDPEVEAVPKVGAQADNLEVGAWVDDRVASIVVLDRFGLYARLSSVSSSSQPRVGDSYSRFTNPLLQVHSSLVIIRVGSPKLGRNWFNRE